MLVQLADIVCVRMSLGDPEWLRRARWPEATRAALDELRGLELREQAICRRLSAGRPAFSPREWTSIETWLDRAHRRRHSRVPSVLGRLPDGGADAASIFALRRAKVELRLRVEAMLADQQARTEEHVRRLLDDAWVKLILLNGSADATDAVVRFSGGRQGSARERRRLTRMVCATLARSVAKTAPLGFSAGTGLAVLRDSESTRMRFREPIHVCMSLNQALANRLISRFHDHREYVTAGGVVCLSAAARITPHGVRWWSAASINGVVREAQHSLPSATLNRYLGQARNPVASDALLEAGCDRATLVRLLDSGVLARRDQVSSLSKDPWAAVDRVATTRRGSEAYREARRWARPFLKPRPMDEQELATAARALSAARDLGREAWDSPGSLSDVLSVDAYRDVSASMSPEDRRTIQHAAQLYFRIAALAYPLTNMYVGRAEVTRQFRELYGDDVPVCIDDVLVGGWDRFDAVLGRTAQKLRPTIDPINHMVWPDAMLGRGPYAEFYRRLDAASRSSREQVHLPELGYEDPSLRTLAPTVDVICRLWRSPDERLSVLIEGVTMPDRLTERHLEALKGLGPATSAAVRRHLDARDRLHRGGALGESELDVVICESPAIPRLQNLSRLRPQNERVLVLSEPAPTDVLESWMSFSDVFVRYDREMARFRFTEGPAGPPLRFHWRSPLSPSFSRRLHLLRYLALCGAPVLTAPRWIAREATGPSRIPRLQMGPLTLGPRRWSLPAGAFDDCLATQLPARRHARLALLRRRQALPARCFVYSAGNTRPEFIDAESSWGSEVLLQRVRRARDERPATILIEEVLPEPGAGLVDGAEVACSFVFTCTARAREIGQ